MGNTDKLKGSPNALPEKKIKAGPLSRAISKTRELIGLAAANVLTVRIAKAEWKDSPNAVTHGQNGGNGTPFNVYLDPGKTQAVQVFASNHGGSNVDLYCANSIDGADTYAPEIILDDSLLTTKINGPGTFEGSAALRFNSGTGKYDLYYVSDGIVFESTDFDALNCKAQNEPTGLPGSTGKINYLGQTRSITIDPIANDKLYYTADAGPGGKFYVSDFGVWDKTAVAGFTDTADNWGLAVYNGNMIYTAKLSLTNTDIQWKPFVSGAGVGATAKIETFPGMTAVINDTSHQGDPMVDAKGILWHSNGSPGVISRKDPIAGGTDAGIPDAGTDAGVPDSGTDSGAAGSDSGTDSGTAGTDVGTDSGAAAGAGGADAGMAGAAGAGGEPDANPGMAGQGGTDGSFACPITVDTISGSCSVDKCDGTGNVLLINDGTCDYQIQPAGYDVAANVNIIGKGVAEYGGSDLYASKTLKISVEDMPKSVKVPTIYVIQGYGDLSLGPDGTIYEAEPFAKESPGNPYGEDFVRITVVKDQITVRLNNSALESIDFGHGAGVMQADDVVDISLTDAKFLGKPSAVPGDGGITLQPDKPGDSGCGCSVPGGQQTHADLIAVLLGIVVFSRLRRAFR